MTRVTAALALILSACAPLPPDFTGISWPGDKVQTADQAIAVAKRACAERSFRDVAWKALLHVRTWHVWQPYPSSDRDAAFIVDVRASDGAAGECLETVVTVD